MLTIEEYVYGAYLFCQCTFLNGQKLIKLYELGYPGQIKRGYSIERVTASETEYVEQTKNKQNKL